MAKLSNVIDVSLCPSCDRLTTMKKIKGSNYFCRFCHQKFKQHKNGRLLYIPLAVADAIERTKNQIKFDFAPESPFDMGMGDIIFEPDLEDDLDKE